MKTYTYTILGKIWYRYINIIITLFLLLYTIASLYLSFKKWYYIIIFLVNLLIILAINNFYIKSYKYFPFIIESDEHGIICSKFFLSKKIIRINFSDISEVSGGMFSGWNSRPVYIHDIKHGTKIGFFPQAKFKELIKVILQNINEDLYKELLEKMKAVNNLK